MKQLYKFIPFLQEAQGVRTMGRPPASPWGQILCQVHYVSLMQGGIHTSAG